MIDIQEVMRVGDILSRSDLIHHTPLQLSRRLSEKYNANIFLKREDLQSVRSYKIRGAYNKISSLDTEQRSKGIVCASAGNHAQGVAHSCATLSMHGTIFMPKTTPEQKIHKTKKFGGSWVEVVLHGDTFDDAYRAARDHESQTGKIFIHPFDDRGIIAGQATVALEILEDAKELGVHIDYIFAPVGGGGLISGIISVVDQMGVATQVIGVETLGASAMHQSLSNANIVSLDKIDTFADGVAVKRAGDLTFQICQKYNLPIELVPENRVCTTLLDYLREDGIVLEPAGAITTDALKNFDPDFLQGKTIVLILSGSNFDFERLNDVKERSMKYEGGKKYLLVNFPQRPGALKEFLNFLGPADDIVRFEYLKKSNKDRAPALIGIESQDGSSGFEILFNKLRLGNITYQDITDNEMLFNTLI